MIVNRSILAKIIFGIFLSLLGVRPVAEAHEPRLKIHILSRYSLQEVKISSPSGDFRIKKNDLKETIFFPASSREILEVVTPQGVRKQISGRLKVEVRKGRLFFTEEIPLEAYVARVLASELPGDFPLEAMKAQAVLIRTYALAHLNRHASEGFHFCDLTHCQVFGDLNSLSPKVMEAVRQTRGLILSYRGEIAEALYHSTCGGHTAANQEVFGGRPLPYLQGVDDEGFCSDAPNFRWEQSLPLKKIETALKSPEKSLKDQNLRGLKSGRSDPLGRLSLVRLEGEKNYQIPTEKFLSIIGKNLGWNLLKSNWFEVQVQDDVAFFKGRGLGHGVGLCQWGAKGMAEQGKNFKEILAHYFPATHLKN